MEKYCSGCQKTLSISEFYVRGKGDRKGTPYEECKKCMTNRVRAYYHKNRDAQYKRISTYRDNRIKKNAEVIDKLKSVPCKDCKKTFYPCAMDFDHLEGVEKVNHVSALLSQGCPLNVILKEVKKCEVVCSNCHRIRTYNRRQALLAHR